MIDKINNQKYYEYTKAKQQNRGPVDSSEFNQNLEREGVIYEKGKQKKPAKPKETAEISEENHAQNAKAQAGAGVKVDISDRGYQRAEKEKQRKSIVEDIRKYAAIAVNFLKSVWDKVWNDPKTVEDTAEFPDILEETLEMQAEENRAEPFLSASENALSLPAEKARLADYPRTNELHYSKDEIRRLFRRGNRKEIEDFISNYGERQLAKNTELLTQYDKKGSIINLSNSDKELILHGNKNEVKL